MQLAQPLLFPKSYHKLKIVHPCSKTKIFRSFIVFSTLDSHYDIKIKNCCGLTIFFNSKANIISYGSYNSKRRD